MNIFKICFDSTIKILKFNFLFIILLHGIKSFFTENPNWVKTDHYKHGIVKYITKSDGTINNKSIYVSSMYTYYSKELTVNHSNSNSDINLKSLLDSNNIKYTIKLTMFLDLNIACSILNLLIISYLKLRESNEKYFGKYFFHVHFILNFFILTAIIFSSLFYFLMVPRTDNSFDNNHINEFIVNYIKKKQLAKGYLRYFINVNDSIRLYDNIISKLFLKLNIIFIIISTCFLSSYGYLLHIDYKSNKKSCKEPIVKKLNKKANMQLQWILNLILIVFALNIWDFSEIYHHFNAKSLLPTSLNNNNNSTNLKEFKIINYGSLNYTKDLYYNEETNFYKAYIHNRNIQMYKKNQTLKQYEELNRVKIMFYFKSNNRLLSNILIVVFMTLIINKLDSFENICSIIDLNRFQNYYTINV
jgi:hypothetical protein